uniref:SFRICE_000417 n=1 Tax=Spodoptera frugiperda TaxID=7108 RepID=A0A2H1VR26_SPOFR
MNIPRQTPPITHFPRTSLTNLGLGWSISSWVHASQSSHDQRYWKLLKWYENQFTNLKVLFDKESLNRMCAWQYWAIRTVRVVKHTEYNPWHRFFAFRRPTNVAYMVHFSGMRIAQSVRIRKIFTLNVLKSASRTLARPSRLLSKLELLFSPTLRIRDSSLSSIS